MKWFLGWISDNKGQFIGLMIGLAVAILFLTVGFWETVLLGVCTWVGGYLGAHPEVRRAIGAFFRGLFGNGNSRHVS